MSGSQPARRTPRQASRSRPQGRAGGKVETRGTKQAEAAGREEDDPWARAGSPGGFSANLNRTCIRSEGMVGILAVWTRAAGGAGPGGQEGSRQPRGRYALCGRRSRRWPSQDQPIHRAGGRGRRGVLGADRRGVRASCLRRPVAEDRQRRQLRPGHHRDPGPASGSRPRRGPPGDLRSVLRSFVAGTETFTVFGTTATLLVSEAGRVEAARIKADAVLAAVGRACSRFRPDSELSRLNAAGGGVLASRGGDIAVGGPPPADGWRVRVTDDHAAGPEAPGQTVTIGSGGLATSSTTVRAWAVGGRRMHHIINPATGEPARSCWRTVSVAAASCVDANTASTAAIIRSAAALPWLRDPGPPARPVREDGSAETPPGWPHDPGPAEDQ